MASPKVVECSFLIPFQRDGEISDGEPHPRQAWQWLNNKLYSQFDGRTIAPGVYKGVWKSPRTGAPVHDETRKYIIALPKTQVEKLREVLREACDVFEQQCIYLSVAGYVEFIEARNVQKS